MAGKKGSSGGARKGAGRKPKEPAVTGITDPLEFLQGVWSGQIEANANQVRAATAALPFTHVKLGDGKKGKKIRAKDAAEEVANGPRFGRQAPPKLALVKP